LGILRSPTKERPTDIITGTKKGRRGEYAGGWGRVDGKKTISESWIQLSTEKKNSESTVDRESYKEEKKASANP